ncbi:MAG: TolC family protein [Gammaproteobacteria bacterium]|nr:TolC family protein [Gammaproteobacteria bacterium]
MKDSDSTVNCLGLGSGASRRWLRVAAFLLPALVMLVRTAAAAPSAVDLSRPLSLEQAIQLAIARNPDIRSAQRALEAAEAARRAAVGKLFPQLQALSWYELFPTQRALLLPGTMLVPSLSQIAAPTAQQSTQRMLDFENSQFQDWVFNAGVGLSWPLYAGGRLAAGVRGARAAAEASGYQLERVRQQLIFAVTQTYLGIGVTERTERAVEGSIEQLTEARSNLEEFVRVGKKPRLDLLRVEARLEQTREVLAAVQAQLVTVQGNLRRLLDLDPTGPPLPLASGQSDGGVEIPPVAEAVSLALAHRPDYRAMMSQVEAQRAQLRIAQGARLPEVDLSARAWEAHGNRTGAGSAFRTWEPDSQIMLSISVPVFTGGTLLAEVHRERARLEERNEQLEALSQRVRLEVTQAYAGLHAARTQLDAARADVASADEAFRLEREKTNVGAGIVTDLLQAQAADLQAQTDFYQARAGVRIAETRLQLATGVLTGPVDLTSP